MEIIKLSNNNFDEVVFKRGKLVLVDFYADWCGPCKMLGPVIEDFANTSNKDIIIGKLNVDEQGDIAEAFNIYSIPTFMLVKDGKVVRIEPGFKTKEMLEQFTNV